MNATAVLRRNNVNVVGDSRVTLVMAHGFGCDQHMWRLLVPFFSDRFRIVLFDYVGCGKSDLTYYDAQKYATLQGYATDLVEVARAAAPHPAVLVGHSVSAMIGLLADQHEPGLFDAHVMVGPSPSYIDQGDYVGGFSRQDIDELLATLENNYLGWSSQMAPAIMGAPSQPELTEELNNSFCQVDPVIAARFARATFLGNNLDDLGRLQAPTLILQSTDDMIAPQSVGAHVAKALPDGRIALIDNTGHCPHLTEPAACAQAIKDFLDELALEPAIA